MLGQPRRQPARAGDVARLPADGVDAPEDDVVHDAGVDARPIDQGGDGVGAEVSRVDLAEAAAAPPDGRPDGVDDEGFGHQRISSRSAMRSRCQAASPNVRVSVHVCRR